jgi:hypothetical protein
MRIDSKIYGAERQNFNLCMKDNGVLEYCKRLKFGGVEILNACNKNIGNA